MSDEKKDSISIPNPVSKIRANPWIASTIVLAVVLILVLFLRGSGGVSGNVISENVASEKLLGFVNGQLQGQGEAEVVSTEKEGSLYKVTVAYQGQDIPVYITTDGKYLISQPIPLDGSAAANPGATAQAPSADVPKSDKPVVELFVMSYCPYGTQMEKAILPVASALKDKIDFNIRYTHFTLHGEKEDTENFRQICIREEYPDKFLSYIQCTLDSTDPYNPADVEDCMKELSIPKAKVDTCMETKSAGFYATDSGLSQGYGVQGSPTLVINGVQADSARSPAAVLATICSAFNVAPSECDTELSTDSASPGFGYSTTSGADAAAANCGF